MEIAFANEVFKIKIHYVSYWFSYSCVKIEGTDKYVRFLNMHIVVDFLGTWTSFWAE